MVDQGKLQSVISLSQSSFCKWQGIHPNFVFQIVESSTGKAMGIRNNASQTVTGLPCLNSVKRYYGQQYNLLLSIKSAVSCHSDFLYSGWGLGILITWIKISKTQIIVLYEKHVIFAMTGENCTLNQTPKSPNRAAPRAKGRSGSTARGKARITWGGNVKIPATFWFALARAFGITATAFMWIAIPDEQKLAAPSPSARQPSGDWEPSKSEAERREVLLVATPSKARPLKAYTTCAAGSGPGRNLFRAAAHLFKIRSSVPIMVAGLMIVACWFIETKFQLNSLLIGKGNII